MITMNLQQAVDELGVFWETPCVPAKAGLDGMWVNPVLADSGISIYAPGVFVDVMPGEIAVYQNYEMILRHHVFSSNSGSIVELKCK